MNIQENLNEFDYIIFKVYYKHGESQTKICNSFYECFEEVLDTILEFLENDIDIFHDLDNDNLTTIYMRYEKLCKINKKTLNVEESYSFFSNEIKVNEEQFLEDVLNMNTYIYECFDSWSIRNIFKIQKQKYTYFE